MAYPSILLLASVLICIFDFAKGARVAPLDLHTVPEAEDQGNIQAAAPLSDPDALRPRKEPRTFTAQSVNATSPPQGLAVGQASALLELGARTASAVSHDMLDLTGRPEQTLAVVFALIVLICFYQLSIDSDMHEKIMMKERERNNLSDNYGGHVKGMEKALADMLESSAIQTENIFDGERRYFLRDFLKMIQLNPKRYRDPDLQVPLRTFFCHWLSAFEECSIDPQTKPNKIVTEKEMDECKQIADLVALLVQRLEKGKVSLVSKELEKFKQDTAAEHKEADQHKAHKREKLESSCLQVGCVGFGIGPLNKENPDAGVFPLSMRLGFIKVNMLSEGHASLVMSPIIGLAIAGLNFYRGSWLCFALTCFAEVASIVAVIRFAEVIALQSLEREVMKLEEEITAFEAKKETVTKFYSRLESLSFLWLHRTQRRLEILHEAIESLLSMPEDKYLEGINTLNQLTDRAMNCFGPFRIWFGDDALPNERLKIVVKSQIKEKAPDAESPEAARGSQKVATHGSIQNEALQTKLRGWKDLDKAETCDGCQSTFGIFYSKTHCYKCGGAYCTSCVKRKIPLPENGFLEPVQVCEKCSGWTQKGSASECFSCKTGFGMMSRKHNCRKCGHVFCTECAAQKVALPAEGYYEPVRVCADCAEKTVVQAREAREEKANRGMYPKVLLDTRAMGFLTVRIYAAHDLRNADAGMIIDTGDKADPYVKLRVGFGEWVKTKTVMDALSPVWDQEFFLPVTSRDNILLMEIWDYDEGSQDEHLGSFEVKFRDLAPGAWHREKSQLSETNQGQLEWGLCFVDSPSKL